MRRSLGRLFFSFVAAVAIVLIIAVSIAKIVSLIRGPHDAAQGLESAIGNFWPVILLAIVLLTLALSFVRPRRLGH